MGAIIAASRSLDDLASAIRENYERGVAGYLQAIDAYLAMGRDLLEAREQLATDREFGAWFKEQTFPFSQQWAWTLRKAAEHELEIREAVTTQVVTGQQPNLKKALAAVRGTSTSLDVQYRNEHRMSGYVYFVVDRANQKVCVGKADNAATRLPEKNIFGVAEELIIRSASPETHEKEVHAFFREARDTTSRRTDVFHITPKVDRYLGFLSRCPWVAHGLVDARREGLVSAEMWLPGPYELMEYAVNDARPVETRMFPVDEYTVTDDAWEPYDGNEDWYTPYMYTLAAKEVMGDIDIDPATSEIAQRYVGAKKIIVPPCDGLEFEWDGRVWLNPPWGRGVTERWMWEVDQRWRQGRIQEIILCVSDLVTSSQYVNVLWRSTAVCICHHRPPFDGPKYSVNDSSPPRGAVFAYRGPQGERFADIFSLFGAIVSITDPSLSRFPSTDPALFRSRGNGDFRQRAWRLDSDLASLVRKSAELATPGVGPPLPSFTS